MKRVIPLLLSLIVIIFGQMGVYAQLPAAQGTNCGNAVVISALPYNSPNVPKYTTCGQGNTYNSTHACANSYTNSEDYVFKFTPNATNSCISITLSALSISYGVFVFDGCPNDPSSFCVAQDVNINMSTDPFKSCEINNLQLVAGRTYYIMASSLSGCYNFDLKVVAGVCGETPAGSGCDKAKVITGAPFYDNSRTTCGGANAFNRGNEKCSNAQYLDAAEYTYKITTTVDECVKIRVRNKEPFSSLFVYEGCPTKPSSLCVASQVNNMVGNMQINATFRAGVEYYIVVSSRVDSVPCTTFDFSYLTVDDQGSVCGNAYVFPVGGSTFKDHTTQCKGDEYDLHPGCNPGAPNYMQGEETVYTFTGQASKCVSIVLKSDQTKTAGLYLMDKCPSDPTARCVNFWSHNFTPDDNILNAQYTLPTSGTYYVVVSVPNPPDYSFDYDISLSNSGDTALNCTSAHIVTLPFSQSILSTACKRNDYTSAIACRSQFMNGNDYVIRFTPTKDQCLRFVATDMNTRGGMFLFDRCPNLSPSCLKTVVCDYTPCDSLTFMHTVTAGVTYYLIVDAGTAADASVGLRIDTLLYGSACNYCSTDSCISCRNVGFEEMNFNGWETFTGTYDNPSMNRVLNTRETNYRESRHTMMSVGSYDPYIGRDLAVVSPMGGYHSVKLGDHNVGSQGDMMRYSFEVDSNSQNFLYYFAVIFEDPTHPPNQQPYFRVRVFVGNDEIDCAHFEVRSGPEAILPGFQTADNYPNVRWRNWSLAAIPLKEYIGQTVTIDFTVLDCSQGAHYGYAYIDAYCGNLGILKSNDFLCEGSTVTLTAPDGFASYSWNTGETTRSITISEAGDYSVDVRAFSDILAQGCPATFTTSIKDAPFPKAKYKFIEGCKDSIIEFVDQSTAADTAPIIAWRWDFDDTKTSVQQNPTHHFPGPGTYEVTLIIENKFGCEDTVIKTVVIPDYPVLPMLNALDSIRVCQGEKVQLYADSIKDAVYKWTGPGFSSAKRNPVLLNLQLSQSGWYHLYAELSTDSCQNRIDSTYIEVVPLPKLSIKPDTAICFLDKTVQLWVDGGLSYVWSPANLFTDNTLANPVARISQNTTYSVLIRHSICPDSTLDVEVKLLVPLAPLKVSNDVDVCIGDTFTISATANPDQFFEWRGPGNFFSKEKTTTFTDAKRLHEGYYSVKAYLGPDNFCKFGEDSILVSVHSLPVITIPPVEPICLGDSVMLTANGATTYTWFYEGPVQFAVNPSVVVKPSYSQTIYARGKDDWGCEGDTNVLVEVKEDFFPNLGPDRTLCTGDTAWINLNVADFYETPDEILWNTAERTPVIGVTKPGIYYVTVNINDCVKQDSIKILFQDVNTFRMGNDSLLCEGNNVTIDLSQYGNDISWSDGTTGQVKVISFPGGEYSVVLKNGSCIMKDTIEISYQPQHTLEIGPDTVFCVGGSALLSSNQSAGTFLWTDGLYTAASPTFMVRDSGLHNITLEHTLGLCKAFDNKTVIVETPPLPDLGNDTTVCENQAVMLDPKVPLPASFLWNDGSDLPVYTAIKPGKYSVFVTKGTCTAYDEIVITHNPIPQFTIGPDSTICEGSLVTLDATIPGAATYLWSSGETTPVITKGKAGTYTVTVTQGGCKNTDDMVLNVDLIPVFELGPDTTLCQGDVVNLSAGISNVNYLWSTTETSPSILVKTGGEYSLTVTRGKCSYSDSINVIFQVPPPFDLGPGTTLCQGKTATFSTNTVADRYLWSTGDTTNSITTDIAGNYTLDLVVGACELSDSIRLNLDVPPSIELGDNVLVCATVNMVLNATVPNGSYLWNNGSTSPTYTVTGPGTYSVEVTRGACKVTDEITVDVQPPHTVRLPNDTILCTGENLLVTSITNAMAPVYQWNTGNITPDITVTQTGTYWVEVVSGVCSGRDSIFVNFVDPPSVNLGVDQLLCQGDSILLNAAYPGARYSWNTGDTVPAIVAKNSGHYSVRLYIGRCDDNDQVRLVFQQPPAVDLGPDITICYGESHTVSSNIPNVNYNWSTGSTDPFIVISQPGSYKLVVTDGPCTAEDEMKLIVNPLPPALKDTLICPSDSAFVNAFCQGCSYMWSDGSTQPGKWARPNTLHIVNITNQYGCSIKTDAAVSTDPACWDDIYVPNTFTPNGDGHNDIFKVRYENIKINSIMIFDRWGEMLYKSSNPEEGWDGFYEGELAKQDVYVWKIIYTNQYRKKKEIFGHVNLLK